MKKIILLILVYCFKSYSQNNVQYNGFNNKLQYGFSTKLIFDLGNYNNSNIRIGFASGIGYEFYSTGTTSLNVEYSILNKGLGSFNNKGWSSYLVIAPHFCQSIDKKSFKSSDGALLNNQPLYYFSDLVVPPLQNPYKKSISIGLNFIHFINKHITNKWQRVAHLSIKYNEGQLVYNNDGGAFLKIWGDKEDRYFTGIGFLRVSLKENLAINNFAISFYKFTGYHPMSFEISDELLFSSVDYKDAKQNLFNRGFWSFQIGNSKYGDVFMRYNNPRNIREVQNFIHYKMGFGYHQNPKDSFLTFGGSLNYYQTYIQHK